MRIVAVAVVLAVIMLVLGKATLESSKDAYAIELARSSCSSLQDDMGTSAAGPATAARCAEVVRVLEASMWPYADAKRAARAEAAQLARDADAASRRAKPADVVVLEDVSPAPVGRIRAERFEVPYENGGRRVVVRVTNQGDRGKTLDVLFPLQQGEGIYEAGVAGHITDAERANDDRCRSIASSFAAPIDCALPLHVVRVRALPPGEHTDVVLVTTPAPPTASAR